MGIHDDTATRRLFGTGQRSNQLFVPYLDQNRYADHQCFTRYRLKSFHHTGRQDSMEKTGHSDIPDQLRIEKPQSCIDSGYRYHRYNQPLPAGEMHADEQPDQNQAECVEEPVTGSQMNQMASEQPPNLQIRYGYTVELEQCATGVTEKLEDAAYYDQNSRKLPTGYASQKCEARIITILA